MPFLVLHSTETWVLVNLWVLLFVFCSSEHDNIESDILSLWWLSVSLHKSSHCKAGEIFARFLMDWDMAIFKRDRWYCVLHVVFLAFFLNFLFSKNNSFSIWQVCYTIYWILCCCINVVRKIKKNNPTFFFLFCMFTLKTFKREMSWKKKWDYLFKIN